MGCGVWVVGIGEYSWIGYLDGGYFGKGDSRGVFRGEAATS
jgi:hypothetical protein